MIRSSVLLLSLLAVGIRGACNCPSDSVAASESAFFYFLGPVDENQNPCVPAGGSCTWRAFNNMTATGGLNKIQLQRFGYGTISLYDGDSSPILSIVDKPAPIDDKTIANLKAYFSYYDYITVKFTPQAASPFSDVILVMYAYADRTTTPAPASTTGKPTTTPYNGPYSKNPALVSLDLAIGIDVSGPDAAALKKVTNSIMELVSAMSITTDYQNPESTRLLLQSVFPFSSDGFLQSPWSVDQSSAQTVLGAVTSGGGLQPFVNTAVTSALFRFSVVNETALLQPSRPHAQRVYALFLQNDPVDIGLFNETLQKNMTNLDVHLVIVDFSKNGINYFANGTFGFGSAGYIRYDNTSFTQTFFDQILINSDQDKRFGCAFPQNQTIDVGTNPTVKMPANYQSKFDPTGQKGRYCNFQNTKLTLQNIKQKGVCVSVIYELEVEKDYLRFYDGDGNEQVSLTGMDVSGSKFFIDAKKSKQVTVQFSSNESQVYGGFSFTVKDAASCLP